MVSKSVLVLDMHYDITVKQCIHTNSAYVYVDYVNLASNFKSALICIRFIINVI